MKRISVSGVILFGMLLLAAPALSIAEQEEEPVGLEQITVKGKTVLEPVTSPYSVPESSKLQTEVFTREDIEAIKPESVLDLLQQVPGMEITYQGRQHFDFGSMRGGDYRVVLDGVYLSQTDRILATIPVDTIESVTVVRDTTALTIGPLNQGFIIMKTKRASKLEGGFATSYGSYHAEKEHLYQGAKIGNFDYRVAGTYTASLGKTGWHMARRNASLLFRGGYTGPAFNADLLYYMSQGMREMQWGEILVPSTNKDGTLNWSKVGTLSQSTMKMNKMLADMVAVNLTKPWNDTQTTTIQYALNNLHVSVTDTDQNSREQNLSIRHVINSRNNTLKAGGQFLNYVCPNGQAPKIGRRTDYETYSLFVQDEYRMFNDRLTVDGGIRADKKHYNNSSVTGESIDEWEKETYAYGFGASYKLNRILTLTGRYQYSENALASYQVSADGSSLPPEKRSRYEGGISASIHPTFNPWLTAFYYDTKDQKVSSKGIDPTTGESVSSYIDPVTGDEINFVTTSDVRTRGMEIGVRGQIFRPLTYHVSYSYKTTDNHTTNQGMSRSLASARLSYRYKKFFANVSAHYAGPKNRSSSPAGVFYYELGDYTRVDANVGYNFKVFGRNGKITLYGRNLGDVHYATRYVTGAYKDVGIQYGAELAYSFF